MSISFSFRMCRLSPTASCASRPTEASETRASPEGRRLAGVNRFSLSFAAFACPDTFDNLFEVCLDHNTSHNHFTHNSMHGLETEDQVEFADILKEPVQCLDKDLNEIEQS